METYSLIGYFAAFFTTVSFVPQVIKVIKTKQTKDISLLMYLFFTTGVILWFIYGIIIESIPVILANGITLVLASVVLVMKLREK